MTFDITCSQKLNDGDTALLEEYKNIDKWDVADVMNTYFQRSVSKSYVDGFTIIVKINH